MSSLYDRLALLTNKKECPISNTQSPNQCTDLRATKKLDGECQSVGTHNNLPRNAAKSIHDYELVQTIGKGSFAKVIFAQEHSSRKPCAMKIMCKAHIGRKNMLESVKNEYNLLAQFKSPFIVHTHGAFETQNKFCIALEFCPGGDLYHQMKTNTPFSVEEARFYFAEVAQAFKYLHNRSVCFRDVKPENILMDAGGHLKLSDFGLVKTGITQWDEGCTTVCGTPQYMAPEVFVLQKYGVGSDWWGLGIILFEMIAGTPPFRGRNAKDLFDEVRKQPLGLLRSWSEELKDFFRGILFKLPGDRLGSKGGANEILSHPFMSHVDMEAIVKKTIQPPIVPPIPAFLLEKKDTSSATSASTSGRQHEENFDSVYGIGATPKQQQQQDSHHRHHHHHHHNAKKAPLVEMRQRSNHDEQRSVKLY